MMNQRFKLTVSRIQLINSLKTAQSWVMITRERKTESIIFQDRKMAQNLPCQTLRKMLRLQELVIKALAMMPPTKRQPTDSRVITRTDWRRRGNQLQPEVPTPTGQAPGQLMVRHRSEASAQAMKRLAPHTRSHHQQKQAEIKSKLK